MIAGCLPYFFLSALTWMLLEGYQLYQMLVEVFPASRRRLTFLLVAYGPPAIITDAAAYYDPTGFGTRNHCRLRTDTLFILFFVASAPVILLTNTIFLFMSMCVVYRHSNIPCSHARIMGIYQMDTSVMTFHFHAQEIYYQDFLISSFAGDELMTLLIL